MVTGVSEKERGRGREKKIIITFHSVTKKRIKLFKTKMASFSGLPTVNLSKKEYISVTNSKDFQSWLLLGTYLTSLPRTIFLIQELL